MVNQSIFTAIILIFFISRTANTAEIQNKCEDRLQLYNKIINPYFFPKNITIDDDQSISSILNFKERTKTNNHLIRCDQWEYNLLDNHLENASKLQNNNKDLARNLKIDNHGTSDCNDNYRILYNSPNFIINRKSLVDHVSIMGNHRNTSFFSLINKLNFSIHYLKNTKIKSCNINTYASKIFSPRMNYANKIGFSTFINYKFGDFSVMGSYSTRSNKNVYQDFCSSFSNSNKLKQWTTGLKYDIKNAYLAVVYDKINSTSSIFIDNENEIQSIFLVAQYQFGLSFCPSITYFESKERDIESNANQNLKKYFLIRAAYYFNRGMSVSIDYKINQIDSNGRLSMNSNSITSTISIVY